jgi:hypothetical protein
MKFLQDLSADVLERVLQKAEDIVFMSSSDGEPSGFEVQTGTQLKSCICSKTVLPVKRGLFLRNVTKRSAFL